MELLNIGATLFPCLTLQLRAPVIDPHPQCSPKNFTLTRIFLSSPSPSLLSPTRGYRRPSNTTTLYQFPVSLNSTVYNVVTLGNEESNISDELQSECPYTQHLIPLSSLSLSVFRTACTFVTLSQNSVKIDLDFSKIIS